MDDEPTHSSDEPMASPEGLASPDTIASPEPIGSPELVGSPEEIASPDEPQNQSEDNPSLDSAPDSISSPEQMDEGSADGMLSDSEARPPSPLPPKRDSSDGSPTPEKPKNSNSQMDSKTVETLEGELDFEEEIVEKEEQREDSSPRYSNKVEADEPSCESNNKAEQDIDEGEIDETVKKPQTEQEEGEADEGEVTDEDDLEEGEVKDGATVRKAYPRPVCRFFNKGQCTWGSSCRFIHPGVNDKGNYNMFSPSKPPMQPGMVMMGSLPMPPLPPPMMKIPLPIPLRMRPMIGPDYRPPLPEDAPPVESAWERGLRHAKEIIKKASRRKEQEPDFEDKRMNLSLEPDRHYDYERESTDKYGRSPYRRFSDSYGHDKIKISQNPEKAKRTCSSDDYGDPYDIGDREHQEMWRGGRYENFEVSRWNRPEYERDYRDKERGRRFSRSMEREKYDRRSPNADRWQDDRYGEAQAPRGRGDEWRDPWRRSKTPKGRRSRSQARSGRRSYSSGSSRSFSSRSSRSSSYSYSRSRSSSSKSSHFTSDRSPSGSRSRSRGRVPSRQSGYPYSRSPVPRKMSTERDLYEPRRRAQPRPLPGSLGSLTQSGLRDHPTRSPTMARNSSPPTRPPPRKGPSPVRKVVNISPLTKFSPPHKMTPPKKGGIGGSSPGRKPLSPPMRMSPGRRQQQQQQQQTSSAKAQRKSPPPNLKRKFGQHSPTGGGGPVNQRGPSPMLSRRPQPPLPKEENNKLEKSNERTSRKERNDSFSGSNSSRSASRSFSRSSRSRSSSQSRSRSRSRGSLSRSVSMSSVSSASSSASHSSSLSGREAKDKPTKGPNNSETKKMVEKIEAPPVRDMGRMPDLRNQDRPVKDVHSSKPDRRFSADFEEQNLGSDGYMDRSGLTIPLLVSKQSQQSKDLLKQSGQKPQIKLTLLSKEKKHPSVVEKAMINPEPPKSKHPEKEPPRIANKSPQLQPPPPRKRHASPTPPPPTLIPISGAKAAINMNRAAKLTDKKSTTSRREELLKQLKAVEDAIARKRSKLS